MKGKKDHDNISTDGISIDRAWNEKSPVGDITIRTFGKKKKKKKILINLFFIVNLDFGGQVVYCKIHSFDFFV